jgi:hypothetical protein
MVVHMLRWQMGDENFFTALNNYLYDPRLSNKYATTEDLIAHVESVTGSSYREFFNDWIFGEGYPTYNMVYRLGADHAVEMELGQTQSSAKVEFFEMDVPVRLYGRGNVPNTTSRIVPTPNPSLKQGGERAPAWISSKGCFEADSLPVSGRAGVGTSWNAVLNAVVRDGVPASGFAFAGMTTLRGKGSDAFTSVDSITVVLHHTFSGQKFTITAPFVVDSVKFDPDRWICTANALVTKADIIPLDNEVKMYPNPCTNELTIELPTGEQGDITLYDQLGKMVRRVRRLGVEKTVVVQLGELPAGVYFVAVGGTVGKVIKK